MSTSTVESTSYVAVNLNVGVKVEVDVNHTACAHGRRVENL
jgi:hypothetical protein